MAVTVAVAGGETREVDPPSGAVYAALLDPLELSRHEVSILVDGRPVPEDQPIDPDVDSVRVVRLVRGG